VSLESTIANLRAWLITFSGEKLSPETFDARMSPRPNTDNSVSIHLRSHRDMRVTRGKGRVRYAGVLRVGIVQEVKVKDHTVSSGQLLARTQKFSDACGPDAAFPVERMEFDVAVYSMLPGGE